MTLRTLYRLLALSLVLPLAAAAAQTPATTPARLRPVLVELFTSEGCSSCPPADALLREVNGTHTAAGQFVVGISEHVTYWNNLGWADPFSSTVYTERQSAYSRSLNLDSDYTPQMVVNGRRQFVGSDRAQLQRALRTEQEEPAQVDVRILSASVSGNVLKLSYSATAVGASGTAQGKSSGAGLVAMITEDHVQSQVPRGENSGRTLTHVAVARSFTQLGSLSGPAVREVQVPLPAGLRSAVPHHVILFAQQGVAGPVFGADSVAFQ